MYVKLFWLLSGESVVAPPNPTQCFTAPQNVKDDIHLQRDYSSIHMPSRNWCPGCDLAVWSDMMFGSAFFFVSHIQVRTYYDLLLLLLSVTPINAFFAGAIDGCLLHACVYCCSTATNCSTRCSVMWRSRTLLLLCCCECLPTA